MNILALVGSLRQKSYNRQLAEATQQTIENCYPEVNFRQLSWEDIPFFNEDREFPTPGSVRRMRDEVRKADGLWLFSPEYNHGIPGPFKNLLDWLSRPISPGQPSILYNKRVCISGASRGMSGASRAQDQLIIFLSFVDARLMNQPRLNVAFAGGKEKSSELHLYSSLPFLEAQMHAFIDFIDTSKSESSRAK